MDRRLTVTTEDGREISHNELFGLVAENLGKHCPPQLLKAQSAPSESPQFLLGQNQQPQQQQQQQQQIHSQGSTVPSSPHEHGFEPRYGVKHPSKSTWTLEEDEMLTQLVERWGAKNWPTIASFLDGRSGKQCRERFKNHLDPSLRKGPFTPEEDIILVRMVERNGPRWALIAKHLPGRTDNAIKNRYNSSLRKAHEEGRLTIPHHITDKQLDEMVPCTPPGSPGSHKHPQRQHSTSGINTPHSVDHALSRKRHATPAHTPTSLLSTPASCSEPSSEDDLAPVEIAPKRARQLPHAINSPKCEQQHAEKCLVVPTTTATTPRSRTARALNFADADAELSAALVLCQLKTSKFC